ncbi:PIG-L family deacetylase [Flammeovirga sp. EKP202]|uniref:PIG-L family deacetylase n=1 Tax=Flammeovirga sp. EKP202 TaxID=2770592 RepID=UPI00165FEE82|nr:PIG-L family deacetylase [Flammeovirga sp. EKP202]MBD0400805.1 PIG-L family deacetylase [Flammeovirga sp. EKP202]
MKIRILILSISLFLSHLLHAQTPVDGQPNVSKIIQEINHLNTLGSVMYFAAHPDDENQRVIGYFARAKGYETAYTALTRGDGGQNLIGKEIREELGILRTQELIEARKVDGGQQFFSRANDFGYSKNPEETLSVWDKDQVLADAVWNIRKFRPDIIVTRFSPDRGGRTHGHHTTSAIIAVEAFELAADPTVFPEQLKYVDVWQPKRIYWNTNSWFFRGKGEKFEKDKYLGIDTGEYIPVLGQSVGEIAMAARSKHKCQGFGAALHRGENIEYFKLLKGDKADKDPMEGVETSWSRVEGSEALQAAIKTLQSNFHPTQPSSALPYLIKVKEELGKLDQSNHWVIVKTKKVNQLLLECAGIWLEALTPESLVAQGDSLIINVSSLVRTASKVTIEKIKIGDLEEKSLSSTLTENKILKEEIKIQIPENFEVSQPYWLKEKATKGMYVVNDQQMIGLPEQFSEIPVEIQLNIDGVTVHKSLNIWQKRVYPAKGERYIPLKIVPPVSLTLDQSVWIFGDNNSKEVTVSVLSNTDNFEGTLKLATPKGWKIEPQQKTVALSNKGQKEEVKFTITPPKRDSEGELKAVIEGNNKTYNQGLIKIDYDHIYRQVYLKPASAKIIKLNIDKGNAKKIAYLMGAGDAVPESLEAAGYHVDVLSHEQIKASILKEYDALIIGIRAYNVLENMRYLQPEFLKYAEEGGTVIVQYNTSFRVKVDQVGPYPLKLSRDRITVEESPVSFIAPKHRTLNAPNKISEKDFDHWVQERGLYYPNEWGKEYTAVLKMQDPNENPVNGALLVADYGKGAFIYSGISWFRELPAGVSGAYRLFANLLDYKPSNSKDIK